MILPIAFLPLLAACAPAPQDDPPIPADTEVLTTDSGLKYCVLTAGPDGAAQAKLYDEVTVHYTGWLTSGKVFDTSSTRGPATFKLGRVIEGWNEGVQLMSVGAKFKFTIPWNLAYGESGTQGIPPKSDLIFVVELLGVKPAPEQVEYRLPAEPTTTASGLKYEVIAAGEGESPKDAETFELGYTWWTDKGERLGWDWLDNGPIKASCAQMRLAFLKEVPLLMKPGAVFLCEVPPALCFGEQEMPKLPANSTTVWRLELLRVIRPLPVPPFAALPEEGVKTTPSGLRYIVIEEGSGTSPAMGQEVTVHYAGWLTTGTCFDNSFKRGEPTSFRLGMVIPGWNEGLQLMKPGAKYKFHIPWNLAYGEGGRPPTIPPKADLIFLVELQKVGN